jgi:hypothetical protein
MKRFCIPLFLFILAYPAFSQARFNIKNSIDWTAMELNAQTSLSLASVNIKLPGGRVNAEELIDAEYIHIIRPLILELPVDSSHTIGDLLQSGELNLSALDKLSRPAKQSPTALSSDMGYLTSSYTVSLKNIGAALANHTRASDIHRQLAPIKPPAYTGVIIIAADILPIHGRNSSAFIRPCLFPKIWDTDMNLIYEKKMAEPALVKNGVVKYAGEESIFQPTPSGMDADIEALVGNNPLRIIARGVFGETPSDPIIDREDALLILASESNIRLLRESRVVIVLNQTALKPPF